VPLSLLCPALQDEALDAGNPLLRLGELEEVLAKEEEEAAARKAAAASARLGGAAAGEGEVQAGSRAALNWAFD